MMKKTVLFISVLFFTLNLLAQERELVWPKGKMPSQQAHQIAAMTDESGSKDFNADKHRIAYLEWYDAEGDLLGDNDPVLLLFEALKWCFRLSCHLAIVIVEDKEEE